MNRNKIVKSYLKYTVGIFLGIIAVYWIQYNLFPTSDIPTGLGVAEFSLIGGIAFWLERTYKFIKSYTNNKEKTVEKIENQIKNRAKEIIESSESNGEVIVRNTSTIILLILALMLLINLISI